MCLRAGSHVFALLIFCVIVHTMWLGKSLQLFCILPFGIVCLSAIIMNNVCENSIGSVYVGGYSMVV